MSENVLNKDRAMLRHVRHISEGHFYGLRVTNKAKNVSLEKELRTLDAWKDSQNHCYRKEEKDLLHTLERLQKSKEHYHPTDEQVCRHDDIHRTHQRLKNHSSSGSSIVLRVSAVASCSSDKSPPQRREVVLPREKGSAIHRTTGFIDCVICKLPRNSHVKGTDICTCEKGPDKGTHHMHPPALHEDKTRPEFLNAKQHRELEIQRREEHDAHSSAVKNRRKSIDADDTDRSFLCKLQRGLEQVTEAPEQQQKDLNSEKPSQILAWPRLGKNSTDDDRVRMRQDSIDENGPYTVGKGGKRESINEHDLSSAQTRKRGTSFDYGIRRERNESMDSYYSVGELRSRTSTMEAPSPYRRTFNISHATQYAPGSPGGQSHHDVASPSDTFLPKLPGRQRSDTEAFHGLIHPDNIINHHHYLPYEADKLLNKKHHGPSYDNHHHTGGHVDESYRDSHHHDNYHHDNHHDRHHDRHSVHGYYIHKYDHTGTRQIAHIPLGSHARIAEMVQRQHEMESNHYSLLSNLRQLLSVYKKMDNTSPKYPWPSPQSTEMTTQEFNKLKDCRYLRLPKSMEELRIESPVFQ